MARAERILTTRGVAALSELGRHADGGGLYLAISPGDRRRWIWQFQWQGKTREMGLGSASSVGLKEARDERDKWRRVLKEGRDPIAERAAAVAPGDKVPTFGKVAEDFIASRTWKNAKHLAQWKMTLKVYGAPIYDKRVDEIGTADVLTVLRPIWNTKPETAGRVRGRIETILDAARVLGHRPENEANPARWRGHMDKMLMKRQKLTRGHFAAMPHNQAPAFMAALRARNDVSSLALEFAILTAARSGEVLGAVWDEIDLDGRVWAIPAERMKAGRPHRIPLSAPAMAALEQAEALRENAYVFPGARKGKPLSSMALAMVLRRMNIKAATAHGFRSSFRDWAGDETSFARELAEQALAHVVGDTTENAYRRGDALEKRRELMEAWGRYLGEIAPRVVSIFDRKRAKG